MTQKEKAKAYDEALKVLHKYDGANIMFSQSLKEEMFPELKESEDERIRKAILSGLKYLETELEWDAVGDVDILDAYAWLEKHGKKESVDKIEPKFHEGDMIIHKELGGDYIHNPHKIIQVDILDEKYRLEGGLVAHFGEQDDYELVEQKPADEVEPKFKAGNWYLCVKNFYGKGVRFDKGRAYYCGLNGCLQEFDSGAHISIVEELYEYFRLWTIEDAKAGDVLFQDLMGGKIFVYNGVNPNMAILYSFIISNDGEDVLSYHIGKPNTGIGNIEENKNIIHPATKEQCDLLFQEMKEAGYGWDAEKKELKKIEGESAWSEEDEYCIHQLIIFCENCMIPDSGAKRCAHWLKSLKGRYAWKPSEEQMEALLGVKTIMAMPHRNYSQGEIKAIESLYEQLKAL